MPKISVKSLFVLGLVALCVVVSGVQAVAAPPEIKNLKIHYQANALFVPHSVAIKKGWFTEAGFESVERMNFTSGNLAGEALISGDIHVWTPGNMPVISMKHNGVPVVIAGMLNYAYGEYLMIRKDAKVQKPEDLYNIRIGMMVGSTCSGIIEQVALANKIDAKKLKIVNLPPPEQVTSLRNNEIQALLCWPPSPFKVRDIADYRFESKKFSATACPITFSESFLRKNPNTTRAILKVLVRAQDFCEDPKNKEEAMKIHSEISEQPIESVRAMWDDYYDPKIPNGVINERFVKDFEVYTDYQYRNGRIKSKMDVLDYTYTDLLKEIKPENVKVEGRWKP